MHQWSKASTAYTHTHTHTHTHGDSSPSLKVTTYTVHLSRLPTPPAMRTGNSVA